MLEPQLSKQFLQADRNMLPEASHSLYREAEMILRGAAGAVVETALHPLSKLPELTASFATGSALGIMQRLGAPGRLLSTGIGGAMLIKMSYDELSGQRWSQFGRAIKDTWHSADHIDQNIALTKNSLGSFLVDSAIGYAGMRAGSLATAHIAPPARLVKYAVNHADNDGGAALKNLQDRWENVGTFQKLSQGKLEVTAFSQAAEAGSARGDLVRIAKTPEGKILLSAMDVEGHGVKAAKKAVSVQAAIDEVLPQTIDKSASDILSLVDKKLSTRDELSITAALAKYDPITHRLETATASSEFAFVIRASGAVRQLDAKVGGLGLGTDMYTRFPRGNQVIKLAKGDTVVLASDGVFDRFGYGSASGFKAFLKNAGPNPMNISRGILEMPPPQNGIDDTSFVIFRRA